MLQGPEPEFPLEADGGISAGKGQSVQNVDLSISRDKDTVWPQEKEKLVGTALIVVAGTDSGAITGLKSMQVAREVEAAKAVLPVRIEDMDEELVQEQTQAVVEELQKRGACTTLALAKMLGLGKSTELNPLLFLLLEKNVLARVTDSPPIWSLSPTFPVNPLHSSSATPRSLHSASNLAPLHAPAYANVHTFQPSQRAFPQTPHSGYGACHPPTIVTFPPISAERIVKPITTFPPIPADPPAPTEPCSSPGSSGPLHQQVSADYWQSLSQMSGGKNNRNGGAAGSPFKKWKKQKNLSDLQLRLLKELKERGPTRTLELSKIVGLVTCRDVNPSIYDLKQRNLVVKVNNAPPVWQLKEPGVDRGQLKLSEMEVDEDEDRESVPGASLGDVPLLVNADSRSN